MSSFLNPEIFREYDIRGIADRDLASPVIEALGRAFGAYIKPQGINAVTIGYDARQSSPRLCDDIVRGLTLGGINVTILGLCPTPALYFSLFHLEPGAGVMITGSHNPAEFNGFKLCVGKDTIYGEEIQKLRKIMEAAHSSSLVAENKPGEEAHSSLSVAKDAPSHELPAKSLGAVARRPIMPDYIEHLKKLFSSPQNAPLKVVLDAGNGTAGLAAPEIIRAMGCEVIELFSEPDGRFPNHHPDPTIPGNLTALIDTVKSRKADAGIAFDGDSDRIGVVDEQGNILWGDQLMVIFSRDILRNSPGATFVSEVKCSQTMYDDIRSRGGKAIMWKTGHSLIKAKMKELSAAMAGEMSGHLFFADRYFGYDDAIYAACRLVEILKSIKATAMTAHSSLLIAKQNQELPAIGHMPRADTLSTLLADLPKTFNTPEIRFDCPDTIKFKVVEMAKEFFSLGKNMQERPKEVITVDGVRAVFDKGWGLIRASNTQPVLVMRFEAQDTGALEAIRAMMELKVNQIIAGLHAT
jgi:phosphomannomutase/phosphoglucomutase